MVGQNAVATVERALVDSVQQLEGWHHGARGQHLDLQAAARHVVHLLGEVIGVLVEDVLGGPGALEAQADRLRIADHRSGHGGSAHGAGRSVLQKLAARCARLQG